MNYPVYFVNAFSTSFSGGNTAAVTLVDDYPNAEEMRSLAQFFGFSETAFLKHLSGTNYQIRWFTPEVEVSLCGHATLASAKCLFEHHHPEAEKLTFQSLSGELSVRKKGTYLELNFPQDHPSPLNVSENIWKAVSPQTPSEILYAPATRNLNLVYPEASTVLSSSPDFASLRALADQPFFGIAITAPNGEAEYICRYFAPWEGIDEDPVTGSAQTFLAPYWAEKLKTKTLKGYQASARGGRFLAEIAGERVLISGEAIIILKGSLTRPWKPLISA